MTLVVDVQPGLRRSEDTASSAALPNSVTLVLGVDGAGRVVAELAGEVDAHATPALRRALECVAAPSGRMVVDLSGVTFLDASGLSLIMDLARRAVPAAAGFQVRDPSSVAERVFRLAGLEHLLHESSARGHQLTPHR